MKSSKEHKVKGKATQQAKLSRNLRGEKNQNKTYSLTLQTLLGYSTLKCVLLDKFWLLQSPVHKNE